MLADKVGSTAGDIHFVLDNFHGRGKLYVQRALKSAVTQGLLSYSRRRYKIRNAGLSPPVGSDSSLASVHDSGVLDRPIKYRRTKARRAESSMSSRTCSTATCRRCQCRSSSSGESRVPTERSSRSSVTAPKRKRARKQTRKLYRYTVPKRVVKVEPIPEPSSSRAQADFSVGVLHPNKDETQSSGLADEAIKAAIRRTMETETVDVDGTTNSSEMPTESTNGKDEGERSQSTQGSKTSGGQQGNSDAVDDDWLEADDGVNDGRHLFQQPSSYIDSTTEEVCADSSENNKPRKRLVQNIQFTYQTRFRTKSQNQNMPSLSPKPSNISLAQSQNSSIQMKENEGSSSLVSKLFKF